MSSPRLLTGLALIALAGCGQHEGQEKPSDAIVVTVSKPLARTVTDYTTFTGRTAAPDTVDLRARVSGYLDKVFFKEGDEVQKGAKLFEIDRRPYQAQVDQATADLARAKATAKTNAYELTRAEDLWNRRASSKADYDIAVGKAGESTAAVQSAEAALAQAKLNLGFTLVTAPVAGRVSKFNVTPGNLVTADQTLLSTLVSIDPVYAYFDVDERTLLRIRRLITAGKFKSAREHNDVPVEMALADETGFPHRGMVSFVDNKIDPGTGTLQVRGTFPNENRNISPGMFCRVQITMGEPHPALLVPDRALGTDQGQKYLLVVDEKNEVQYRPVRIGQAAQGLRAIEEGLKADERVIINGLQRVRPGVTVDPRAGEMRPEPDRAEKVAQS
jgi:RND family efflux transporter MFP subunit